MKEERIIIHGLQIKSPNERRGNSKLAAQIRNHEVQTIRNTVQLHVASKGLRKLGKPQSVHFVRIGKNRFDSDNNVSAFKECRDGMCRALGFDDKELVIAEVRGRHPLHLRATHRTHRYRDPHSVRMNPHEELMARFVAARDADPRDEKAYRRLVDEVVRANRGLV